MYRYRVTSIIFLLLCVALWVIKSVLETNLYTDSLTAKEIKEEARQLRIQNTLLKEEILHYESLQIINREARSMGFIDGKMVNLNGVNQSTP